MALLEMFGFDNGAASRMATSSDAIRGLMISEATQPGRYAGDGLVIADFAQAHISSAFGGKFCVKRIAPSPEIVMALDWRPLQNILGGPDALWGSDFLEAGVEIGGGLPAPGWP